MSDWTIKVPQYVFEFSVTLPAGDELTAKESHSVKTWLEEQLAMHVRLFGHTALRTDAESPFEHVTGDWLPPDANGVVKMGPSRPIDL